MTVAICSAIVFAGVNARAAEHTLSAATTASPRVDDPTYANDDNDPIPYMDKIDVVALKRDHSGAVLVIVIATPLGADERSQRRLLKKIETYLAYAQSDDLRQHFSPGATPTIEIAVKIDKRSAPEIFELLKRSTSWVEADHASLTVEQQSYPSQ